MESISQTIIVVVICALVLIICAYKFTTLSAQLSALGTKFTLKGHRSKDSTNTSAANAAGGIRKNWLFGKVNIETKGSARIDDNVGVGDVTMKGEEITSPAETRGERKRHNK